MNTQNDKYRDLRVALGSLKLDCDARNNECFECPLFLANSEGRCFIPSIPEPWKVEAMQERLWMQKVLDDLAALPKVPLNLKEE